MKHLRPEIYYNDLYDRFTVEECRRFEKQFQQSNYPEKNKAKGQLRKKFAKEVVDPTIMYFVKAERFADKEKTIRKWMDRDRKLDEFFETAEAPKHIHCLTCGRLMKVIYKDLRQAVFDDEKNRVLFMYECPNKCLPRRAFFDDGKEYVPKPHLCPKCQNHLEEKKGKQLKNKIVINEICHNCGYKHKRIYKFSNPKKKKIDSNFAKDRAHFCLSEKEGSEYISSKAQLLSIYPIIEEQMKKKESN